METRPDLGCAVGDPVELREEWVSRLRVNRLPLQPGKKRWSMRQDLPPTSFLGVKGQDAIFESDVSPGQTDNVSQSLAGIETKEDDALPLLISYLKEVFDLLRG